MNKVLSKWYVFIVWLLISTFISFWAVDIRTNYKKEEVMTIFISADSYNDREISNKLSKEKIGNIKETNIKCVQINDPNYYLAYSTFGTESSDLLILKIDMFDDESLKQFYPLDKLDDSLYDFYKIDEKPYGVIIHSKDDDHINEIISYGNSDYAIFINPNSAHINNIELLIEYINLLKEYVW